MLSRFDTIPGCDRQTNRRTDGRTDRIAMSILRVSIAVLTRDKNSLRKIQIILDIKIQQSFSYFV